MGFERAVAIIQGTKNLTDFSGTTSNYETDVFRPIFDELEKLSGKKYASTLPDVQGSTPARVWRSAARRSRKSPRAAATSTPAACAPQKKSDRRRFPRHRRSHSRAFVRNRRRNHSIKRRPRLRFASHSCVERSATAARSVFTSRSFSNSSTSWRKRWATSFRKSGRNSQRSKKQFAAKKNRLTKRSIKASRIFEATLDAMHDE